MPFVSISLCEKEKYIHTYIVYIHVCFYKKMFEFLKSIFYSISYFFYNAGKQHVGQARENRVTGRAGWSLTPSRHALVVQWRITLNGSLLWDTRLLWCSSSPRTFLFWIFYCLYCIFNWEFCFLIFGLTSFFL